jgi:hypothetical protein
MRIEICNMSDTELRKLGKIRKFVLYNEEIGSESLEQARHRMRREKIKSFLKLVEEGLI